MRTGRRRGVIAAAWLVLATVIVAISGSPALAETVQLAPGTDIQSAVDQAGPGTVFTLGPGVYENQQVVPKDGMQFIGSGADTILTGAVPLTGWKKYRNKPYWYVTGQTQEGQVHGQCEAGWRCDRPEDLFVDGVISKHVSTRAHLEPGTWYFDYGADRIYIGDDPSGKTIETSVTRHAFFGDATGVVIKDLVIEKYAVPAQHGAIDSRTSNIGSHGANWTVDNVEARYNHGGAVYMTDGGRVLNSYLHHNGQQAISGTGVGLRVENTEIAHNNYAHFNLDWEGGASKFWRTTDLVFRNNHSHHNYGTGVWADYENANVLIEDNTVEWNYREGIYIEISLSAVVRNNTVIGNGLDDPRGDSWLWSGGITVAASMNVEIYGNTLSNNGNGITATQQSRGSGTGGPWLIENLDVHHNDVEMFEGQTGIVQDVADHAVFLSRNNHFEDNTYRGDGQALLFAWDDASHTFEAWRTQFGHDWGGRFISSSGDSRAPVLTLIGDDPMTVPVNDPFLDPGALATDNFDPRLTVYTADEIDTSVAGSYVVSYTAIDAAGNVATPVTRTVVVTDPSLPVVTVTGTADAAEAGPVSGTVTLRRTGDLNDSLPVNTSLGGTTDPGVDYTVTPAAVVFPVGADTVHVSVTPVDDAEPEGDETVILAIEPGTGYAVGTPATGEVTITDDDPFPPAVTVAAGADATEAGPTAGSFFVSLSEPGATDTAVAYQLSGSADPGDYSTEPAGPAVIPAGELSVEIVITPVDDAIDEGSESVTLQLLPGSGYVVGTPATDTISIADNDAPSAFPATGETTAKGEIVAGSYIETREPDGVPEVLREELYNRGKRSRLEHVWSFDVGSAQPTRFHLNAHRSPGIDEFRFEISVDGSPWAPLLTVTATNPAAQSSPLPPGATGVIQVRVVDTDRSRSDGTADELFIDWMALDGT